MKLLYSFVLFLIAGFTLSSCGGDSAPEGGTPEFAASVNVNEVVYSIQRIELEGVFKYQDGTDQEFKTVFTSEGSVGGEEVIRRTIDNQFTLQVNGERANVSVGASSSFEGKKELNEDEGGRCRHEGRSESKGYAQYDRLELNYSLDVELRGEDCSEEFLERFTELQKQEVAGLRLNVIKKLQDSGVWNFENTRVLKLKVRMIGVSR